MFRKRPALAASLARRSGGLAGCAASGPARGYRGAAFAHWVASHRLTDTLRLEIVSRRPSQRGFKVLAKRWIVERTFGWFMKHRRLVRDYETKTENAEAMIHITMIGVMLRRLG